MMTTENLSLKKLQERLAGLPVTEIRYLEVTGSTNDDALGWVTQGAQDSSLIVADEQTAGRGRMKRTWVTRKGTSLAFSLIIKPQSHKNLPLYAPLGALGVALAIEKLYGGHPEVKWPNDVLLNREKVCGILTEASWHEDTLEGVVLGIGINIASSAVRKDDDFIFPAGTLQTNLEREVDRLDLLAEVLRNIFTWRPSIGKKEFIQAWNDRLAFRGEEVRINHPGQGLLTGKVLRVSEDGLLVLNQIDGNEVSVSAGDVSLK